MFWGLIVRHFGLQLGTTVQFEAGETFSFDK